MKIEFTLEENDLLVQQLYASSISERIKKTRRRSKVILPLVYLVLGAYFLLSTMYNFALAFFTFGLLWYFFFPIWLRRQYAKNYRNFVRDNFKNRFGTVLILEIEDDFIFIKTEGSESKVHTSELQDFTEIPALIFIKFKSGQSFMLPKDKIDNIDQVKMRLMELAEYLQIKYIEELNWKWK